MSEFEKLTTRIRRVNAQILAAERRYGKDSKIVKRIYHYLNIGQGTQGLTRYRTPKGDASLAQLAKLDRALTQAENSAYLSKEGRRVMHEKALDTFKDHILDSGYFLPDKDVDTLYDTLISIKGTVSEITKKDSWQTVDAIEDAMSQGLSKKGIIELAREYEEKAKNPKGIDYTLADYIRNLGRV